MGLNLKKHSLQNLKINHDYGKEKIIGANFLHNHPITEHNLGVDFEHVIIDKSEWKMVLDYFRNKDEEFQSLFKQNKTNLL